MLSNVVCSKAGLLLNALSVIQGEHRNLGLTLVCFESLLRDCKAQRREPDVVLFRAILTYVDTFLNRFHHPKEDDYLFPTLYRRYPAAETLIEKLQNDHHNGIKFTQKLSDSLTLFESNNTHFNNFHDAALNYIQAERRHIGKEEAELLPLVQEHLTESDWKSIDKVFANNNDPMFGEKPKQSYKRLSGLITNVCIFGSPLL